MQDSEIIDLYFQRSERAIDETAKKYGRLCLNVSDRILRDKSDSEECVNDAYLAVWQKIPPERPLSLSAFVVKIARNIAVRRLRYRMAEKRNPEALISLEELENVLPDAGGISEIEDEALGKLISDFLYLEKEENRKIFVRKYWYLDSITDISEKYHHSESKIKSILFRMRSRLREYLSEKGVEL